MESEGYFNSKILVNKAIEDTFPNNWSRRWQEKLSKLPTKAIAGEIKSSLVWLHSAENEDGSFAITEDEKERTTFILECLESQAHARVESYLVSNSISRQEAITAFCSDLALDQHEERMLRESEIVSDFVLLSTVSEYEDLHKEPTIPTGRKITVLQKIGMISAAAMLMQACSSLGVTGSYQEQSTPTPAPTAIPTPMPEPGTVNALLLQTAEALPPTERTTLQEGKVFTKEQLDKVESGVYQIQTKKYIGPEEDPALYHCSGTLLDTWSNGEGNQMGIILTARHCFKHYADEIYFISPEDLDYIQVENMQKGEKTGAIVEFLIYDHGLDSPDTMAIVVKFDHWLSNVSPFSTNDLVAGYEFKPAETALIAGYPGVLNDNVGPSILSVHEGDFLDRITDMVSENAGINGDPVIECQPKVEMS